MMVSGAITFFLGLRHLLGRTDRNRNVRAAHEHAAIAFLDLFGQQPITTVGSAIGLVAHHALGEETCKRFLHREIAGLAIGTGEERA